MNYLELITIEEALEACLMLYRDGFIHGPGSHYPEEVFTGMVPDALTIITAARLSQLAEEGRLNRLQ